ncbi:hypothetical protein KRX51_06360 [Corynebacterium sp. TAE3-ERU12]|uniref:hypothetical protein n=1 Tax=Corynebacterium sp. TAE3-ERU12 TaxID=2849491 RepID=UPI001C485FEC|nr:hypothetical protein [Corynebacterium sp. TAE3-ERU12]MBV7295539.1 hypothetical protein [Corynebacterium sp. TAE3-ERU12]
MANVEKKKYVDPGWPQNLEPGEHPVTELVSHHAGADSPFGEITFPVDPSTLGYVHPHTVINK